MDFLAKDKNIQLVLKIDERILPFIKNLVGDEGRYT
jgi:hypothetical protein